MNGLIHHGSRHKEVESRPHAGQVEGTDRRLSHNGSRHYV